MLSMNRKALIIGSNGTIGKALLETLSTGYDVRALSRQDTDYSDASLERIATNLAKDGPFQLIVCCIGVLHNEVLKPEKRLSQLDAGVLAEYFRINTIVPSLCLKHFCGLLDKQQTATFVALSAMVGSISDNNLGGWYGYRSSKAALNMMVKTASIEVTRSNKHSCLLAVHPGTTMGALSKPYSSRVSKDKYYSALQTATRISALVDNVTAADSGHFLNWDGLELAW